MSKVNRQAQSKDLVLACAITGPEENSLGKAPAQTGGAP